MAAQCNAGVRLLFRSHVQTLRQKRSLFRSWVQWELCRRESLVLRSSERTAGWEWILQTCQWCCREKPEQEIRWYWTTGSNRTAVYDVWLYWGGHKTVKRDRGANGERWCSLTLPAGSSHTACSAWLDLEPERQGCRSHGPLSEETIEIHSDFSKHWNRASKR